MSNPNAINAALDQVQAAVRDNNGAAARKVIEDLGRTDPEAAQTVLDGLTEAGKRRLRGR